jgi:succinyl-diaminopimelate desuccinylase
MVDTLAWLVDIPSETGKEERICGEIAARLAPTLGDGLLRSGDSLIAGRRRGKPLVLLVGHLDTVPAQGQPPARVEAGRLYGLGASDMKAGLAVMIHLLEELESERHDVIGVFYSGEEGPSSGNALEPLLSDHDWLSAAEFAVVLEPCDREIQIGCNGVLNAVVTFRGHAAHSARPWLGENAITKGGRWLARMHEMSPVAHVIDGLEFREVMSVTRASGGIATNVIPAEFSLHLNYRFTPDLSPDQARERVADVCSEADGVEVVDLAPAGPVDASHPLVAELAAASGARIAPKQGWTDVARLGAHGIPAVNFGPGETALAHQRGESVRLDDLRVVYDALSTVLG